MNNSWILLEINVLIILIALLTLIYVNKLRFRYQRMLLLGAPILAMLIIGLKSIWPGAVVTLDMPLINLDPVVVGQNIETISTPLKLTWTNLYFLGVILFLIVSLLKITRTALIFRNEDYDISEGVRLYRIANRHSFSFFNRIQLSPELDENAAEMVLDHEKLHVKKQHSLDLILMEIMHAIFWFNPVFFWLKSRLVNVHEYEVDENLFSKYDVNYMHFLLNYAMGIQSTKFVLSNPFFNQLTLKQRIMTMKTERQFSLKFWLILPVIAISGFFVQCTEEKVQPIEDRQSMAQDEESIQDEVLEMAEVMPEFEGGARRHGCFYSGECYLS